MTGKVWLVGAGPGDIGLLTVKGRTVIKQADVIVYDHLVGKEILSALDDRKKLINAGKLAGHHPIPQDQINRILVAEALKGQKVVRLKGGDPFLFGRGGEELEELRKYQIPFEVVPGVTSSLAVPAYSGIPVTHRTCASSVHIITGHKRQGKEDTTNYRALVQAGGTLVFLMGVTALPQITKRLLEAGMDPKMPSAVLQEGTTAGQRCVMAPLKSLEKEAKEAGIHPPAIIVVGPVCKLSETLAWYEKLPLQGMRVILTRPKELISVLAEKLRVKGAEVLELPAIDTVPIENNQRLWDCFQRLEAYHWIAFTSQVGVRIFFEQMERQKTDIRKLSKAKFAVIGEGTKKALRERGIYADLMPEVYDGESLGRLLAREEIKGQQILIPRAEKGNEALIPILEKAGARVEDVAVYQTVYRECRSISVKEEIGKGTTDLVVFTSSSTVKGFVAVAGGIDYTKIKAACIGRQTADTAKSYGMKCYVAKKATLDSLVELVTTIKETGQKGK